MRYSTKYKCYATENGLLFWVNNGKLVPKSIREHNTTEGYTIAQFNLKTDMGKKHINVLVHRVVWDAFNDEIPEGYEIDHIDFNRNNNNVNNLRLLSVHDNRSRKRGKSNE